MLQVKLSPQAEDEVLAARLKGLSQQKLDQIPRFTALGFFPKHCHEPQNVYISMTLDHYLSPIVWKLTDSVVFFVI